MLAIDRSTVKFQSTPSARRATTSICDIGGNHHDFNPRPPRGGRHFEEALRFLRQLISIHALREEGDPSVGVWQRQLTKFQSTPSARRATWITSKRCSRLSISIHALREEGDVSTTTRNITGKYFNPRPPRGGRPRHLLHPVAVRCISIHALREEGDLSIGAWRACPSGFQSTPSARRATPRL